MENFKIKKSFLELIETKNKLFINGDPRFVKTVLPSFIANLHPTLLTMDKTLGMKNFMSPIRGIKVMRGN